MNIALLGNGHVAQALIKIIDKTHNILLSYDRSSNFYDIPKNNDIDIVIDMLGHNDDAVEISRNNGNLFINSLVASSKQFVLYPEYLSIDKFMSIQDKTDIFKYRGAGPEETAEFINNEIIKIGQLKNAE